MQKFIWRILDRLYDSDLKGLVIILHLQRFIVVEKRSNMGYGGRGSI
jgi:hypothetical protein